MNRLSHQDEEGRVRMVDVGDKARTRRSATATGAVLMKPTTVAVLIEGRTPKGDPLLVAQIAGVQAAKRTAELIPLCHPLALSDVDVQLEVDEELPGVRATATTRVEERTGVEMEALTAVSVALLTVYDMLKAVDRDMRLSEIRLLHKSGGRTGEWLAEDESARPEGEDYRADE